MYITLDETKSLIKRILDVYSDNGSIDDSQLQLVIDEAEGMVNASIASRYAIPVTDTNSVAFLRSLIVPIIRMKSYTQFAETEDTPDIISTEYKETLKILKDLSRQIISLPDTSDKKTGRPSYIGYKATDTTLDTY